MQNYWNLDFNVNGDSLPGPLIIGTFEKRAPGPFEWGGEWRNYGGGGGVAKDIFAWLKGVLNLIYWESSGIMSKVLLYVLWITSLYRKENF